jgi:hypothetical protein
VPVAAGQRYLSKENKMKRTLMVLVTAVSMSLGAVAFAQEAGAKPDCGEKVKALDDAKAAAKTAGKADLSSCKDMKGKEKKECETPLKAKAKEDAKAAKEKVAGAKKDADCCKNPKKKGC